MKFRRIKIKTKFWSEPMADFFFRATADQDFVKQGMVDEYVDLFAAGALNMEETPVLELEFLVSDSIRRTADEVPTTRSAAGSGLR